MNGYMYILECSDGSYYTGSTQNIELRLAQHQNGQGAKHTRTRLPVKLVFLEAFSRIDEAYFREKQVQGWSRKKKQALMRSDWQTLHDLAVCRNESHFAEGSHSPATLPSTTLPSTTLPSTTLRERSSEPRSLSVVEGKGKNGIGDSS